MCECVLWGLLCDRLKVECFFDLELFVDVVVKEGCGHFLVFCFRCGFERFNSVLYSRDEGV